MSQNTTAKYQPDHKAAEMGTKQQLPLGTAGEIHLQLGDDWSPKAIILLSKSGFQSQTFCPKTQAKAVFRWLRGGLSQQFPDINSLLVQAAQ